MSFEEHLTERLNALAEQKQAEQPVTEPVAESQENISTKEVETNNQSAPEATPVAEATPEVSVEPKVEKEVVKQSKYSNDQVEELDAFYRKYPEKTFEDYLNLKRPIDSIDKNELIKEFLSAKEGMSEAEIKLEMKKMEVKQQGGEDDDFGFDEDDEVKNLEAEALLEKRLREATAWKEQNVSEQLAYEKSLDTQDDTQHVESIIADYEKFNSEQAQKNIEEYYTTAFQHLGELKEFGMNINGEIVSVDIDDSLRGIVKESLDTSAIAKKFFNEQGKLVNHAEYFESLAWFNEESREILLKKRDEQIEARVRAEVAKVRRNINLDGRQTVELNDKPNVDNIRNYIKS